MITAERKPLSEIKEMIAPYRKILVVGCGSCVAECAAGGEKEVGLLASALRMAAQRAGRDIEIKEITLDRQCVYEFIEQLTEFIDQYDVVLSLGCGAEFIQTQCVYNLVRFKEWMEQVMDRGIQEKVSILGGVLPH